MADAKTVDSTEAPAAGDVNVDNTDNDQDSSRDAKTVDNTKAPEADESNEDSAKDNDKPAEAKPAEDAAKDAKSESDSGESDDDLDDDELDALDAKVRRRVSKVQRENVNLRGRLKDAEGARDKVQRENERLTVALNAGLGGDLLKFLTGDTVEELEKNAADLLAVIGYNGRVTPSNGPIERGNNPRRGEVDPASAAANETNLDSIGARIYRR